MTRFAIPAIAAAAALAVATPVAAQQASFCGGALVANSFASQAQSNGATTKVEYRGHFQNRDPQGRRLTVTPVRVSRIGNLPVTQMIGSFSLDAHEQRDIGLLTIQANNPSGAGAPSAPTVGRQVQMVCRLE